MSRDVWSAVLDDRTCDACRARSGSSIEDVGAPPLLRCVDEHGRPACRCVAVEMPPIPPDECWYLTNEKPEPHWLNRVTISDIEGRLSIDERRAARVLLLASVVVGFLLGFTAAAVVL